MPAIQAALALMTVAVTVTPGFSEEKQATIDRLLAQRRAIQAQMRVVAGSLFQNADQQTKLLLNMNLKTLALIPDLAGARGAKEVGAQVLVAAVNSLSDLEIALQSNKAKDWAVLLTTADSEYLKAVSPKRAAAVIEAASAFSKAAQMMEDGEFGRSSEAAFDGVAATSATALAQRSLRRMGKGIGKAILDATYGSIKDMGGELSLLQEQGDLDSQHRLLILMLGENTRRLRALGVVPRDALQSDVQPTKSPSDANKSASTSPMGGRKPAATASGSGYGPATKALLGEWKGYVCGTAVIATLRLLDDKPFLKGTIETYEWPHDRAPDGSGYSFSEAVDCPYASDAQREASEMNARSASVLSPDEMPPYRIDTASFDGTHLRLVWRDWATRNAGDLRVGALGTLVGRLTVFGVNGWVITFKKISP